MHRSLKEKILSLMKEEEIREVETETMIVSMSYFYDLKMKSIR